MDSYSKLNLACGLDYREGYINIDDLSMFPIAKVDIERNVYDIELPPESVSEVVLSHFIMYARPKELDGLLKKIHSWLIPGGKVDIESSNIRKVCEIVANSPDEEAVKRMGLINIFGHDDMPPHRWGWYPESVIYALYESGFKNCYFGQGRKKPERDFRVVGIK